MMRLIHRLNSSRYIALVGCVGLLLSTTMVRAQTTQTAPPGWPITAAEDARAVPLYTYTGITHENGIERIPRDQTEAEIERRTEQWVATLQKTSVTGMQLDPLGRLAVLAGQEDLAKRQFSSRLATPGLSAADKAYTLLVATSAFGARGTNAARMQTALDYLAQLEALPASVDGTKLLGRVAVARSYYAIGKGDPVVTHLTKALAYVPQLPFDRRPWKTLGDAFMLLANVVSAQPSGRERLDSTGQWLLKYTLAPADFVARDSAYYWGGKKFETEFKKVLQMTGFLGRTAPEVVAQYWFNTSAPNTVYKGGAGATTRSFNDGMIRVLEYGGYG